MPCRIACRGCTFFPRRSLACRLDFGFGAESGDIEEFVVDTFCTVYKGTLEQHREENPEQGLEQGHCFTPLLTGKALEVALSKQTALCMSW